MINYMSFLGHYKNMVDNSLCDNIINTNFKFQKSTYSTHKGLSPDKERVKMDEIWIRKNEKFYDEIKDIVSKVSDLYTAKMKRVNKRDFIVSKSTDFRLNRYDVGGYMSLHTDNIHHSHGQKFGYPQASVLLFLNDDFKGGQFVVSNIHLNISKGDALIFPSNFMFPHEVKKVTKGTRWSIISWLM